MNKLSKSLLCGLVLTVIVAGCAGKNVNENSASTNSSALKQNQTSGGASQTSGSNLSPVTTVKKIPVNEVDIVYKKEAKTVKMGDKVAGLTVKSIEASQTIGRARKDVGDITFLGEIELVGECKWVRDSEFEPLKLIFSVDDAFVERLPQLKSLGPVGYMRIRNPDYAEKFLPKQKSRVKAKLVIDNFSVGERQVFCSADLVRVIEMLP